MEAIITALLACTIGVWAVVGLCSYWHKTIKFFIQNISR